MAKAELSLSEGSNNSLVISLTGDWLLNSNLPGLETVFSRLSQVPKPKSVAFESDSLGEWNTGLVKALIAIVQNARTNSVEIDDSGLPNGAQRLVSMAFAVEERQGARRVFERKKFLEQVGESVMAGLAGGRELLAFTGELVLSCGRFLRGKATFQRSNVTQYIQEAGIEALPIVSLICFLIGMIFAFVGVIQLESFGAGIYTADLVAVAMVREMSAIMTGIIMAGRTGAAYAAQIGTMKVNEEIDALTTLGMHPIDFMVTPRVFALILMMPLLTVYASLMGIMGGALVGLSMLDVTLQQYVAQTLSAVHLNSLFGGLFKSIVYGILIALVGCQQGMACGNSAMAVGQCTTKAVVMGIVLIVASASILTVIYINLGI
ncbi:MAG: ABC transporter permease [Nitrosomonas sp.]|nr:MAG: ABC transporter permease [Nitrosomonas sp.]